MLNLGNMDDYKGKLIDVLKGCVTCLERNSFSVDQCLSILKMIVKEDILEKN